MNAFLGEIIFDRWNISKIIILFVSKGNTNKVNTLKNIYGISDTGERNGMYLFN